MGAGVDNREHKFDGEILLFVEGLQALSTDVESARLTIQHNGPLHDIGPELPIGMPLGKADVMPELRTFATYFTLSHLNHLSTK